MSDHQYVFKAPSKVSHLYVLHLFLFSQDEDKHRQRVKDVCNLETLWNITAVFTGQSLITLLFRQFFQYGSDGNNYLVSFLAIL
jgi:hypothetical protein